ncbi:uncharacterized protein LOC100186391 isoform X1 [Ciona intestinalis]
MLRIESSDVIPARIDSSNQDAFQGRNFTLVKPRWVDDSQASSCKLCHNKFNQIRRRHHCRSCGLVLCNKCCSEKLPLPQFGSELADRVCSACFPIASCVTMSFSPQQEFRLQAALSLSILCRDKPAPVVALGGAHMLVNLAKLTQHSSVDIMVHISSAIHTLLMHTDLVEWFVSIGVLNALSVMLGVPASAAASQQYTVLTESLNSLRTIAKANDSLKLKVAQNACLSASLQLCSRQDPSISLVAATVVSLIAQYQPTHGHILVVPNVLRTILLKISNSEEEQITEQMLKILEVLSKGNDEIKHSITSEDAACGSLLAKVFQTNPKNLQIYVNTASTVGNLATNSIDQVLLQSSFNAVLSALNRSFPNYVTYELIRAAANFAYHQCNSQFLIQNFSTVVKLLNHSNASIQNETFRCLFNLFSNRSMDTIQLLSRNGVESFLTRFSEQSALMENTKNFLNSTKSSYA